MWTLLLYALFLSVIMSYIIMVYQISGVFIYLKTNPHAVFISLWFRQNKFFKLFFLLLSKLTPTLMKIFPQSHIVGQCQSRAQSWVSVIGIRTPCWVSNIKANDTYSLHILAWQCMSLLSCRCQLPPNDLRVKDCHGGCWVVSDSHSVRGSRLSESLVFLTRLCCVPWASSCAIPDKTIFSFTVFCQWSRSEMRF